MEAGRSSAICSSPAAPIILSLTNPSRIHRPNQFRVVQVPLALLGGIGAEIRCRVAKT
jgi:hypothetical protein